MSTLDTGWLSRAQMGAGVIAPTDGTTDAAPALQVAFNTQPVVHIFPGNYYIGQPVALPLNRDVTVFAYGAKFLSSVSNMALFSRMPADQAAASVAVAYRVNWFGGSFVGNAGAAGQTGLQIGATYASSIEHAEFTALDTGLDVQFGLMTAIRSCRATNNRVDSFVLRNGQWTGAGVTNAQSNSSVLDQCRVYSKAGANSAFKLHGTSGVSLRDCITEGANPTNNVEIDGLGSSVAKGNSILGLHSENAPSNAVIKAKLAGGDLIIDRLFAQGAVTLIDDSGSAGSTRIEVRSMPYFQAAAHKFKHETGTPTLWSFDAGFVDPDNPSIWIVDGTHSPPPPGGVYWKAAVAGAGLMLGAGGAPGSVNLRARLTVTGDRVTLSGIPTFNPGRAGELWNDGGTIKISAG